MHKHKLFNFKYHTFHTIIVYSIIFLLNLLFDINIGTIILIKFIGTLYGYLVNDIYINSFIIKYSLYFQNIIKHLCIFIFQSITATLLLTNFNLLNNVWIINLYLFVYFLLDVITDIVIKDTNEHKELYINVIRIFIGFIIVENLLNSKLKANDYIFIIINCIALIIYYNIFDKYLKSKLDYNYK